MLVRATYESPSPAIRFAIDKACPSFQSPASDSPKQQKIGVVLVDDSNEKLFTTTARECKRRGVPLIRCQATDQLQRMLINRPPVCIWLAGKSPWIERSLLLCAQKVTAGSFVVLLLDSEQEIVLASPFPWATHVPLQVVKKPTKPEEVRDLLERTVIAQQYRRYVEHYLTHYYEAMESFLPCEKEILHAICNGKMNKQIAIQMEVSIRTVEKKRQQIFQRLDVSSAGSLGYLVGLAEAFQEMGGPS